MKRNIVKFHSTRICDQFYMRLQGDIGNYPQDGWIRVRSVIRGILVSTHEGQVWWQERIRGTWDGSV